MQAAEGPSVLIGVAAGMHAVHRLIATVAPTESSVLIMGETGTGKELVARTLYQQSLRAEMPFVPVNCGALSESLVESELFGHRKGSFTGADREHKGLFEVANGGTLFLDELGELNKNIQVKLLRFLESGEIRRVGETSPFRTDVRVLCATNRDLRNMVASDDFREDLFFRVNTFEIRLPPLRERRSDIPELAVHLLARAARRPVEQGAELLGLDAAAALQEYDWPGNVRELANAMEYSLILSRGQRIAAEHLPQQVRSRPTAGGRRNHRPSRGRGDSRRRETHPAGDRNGAHSPHAREEQGPQAADRPRTRHQPEDALQQAQFARRRAPRGRLSSEPKRRFPGICVSVF